MKATDGVGIDISYLGNGLFASASEKCFSVVYSQEN